VGAREIDNKYYAVELGDYDEFRGFVTISFGPITTYFEPPKKRVVEKPVGEAPASDTTPPQVTLALSTTSFSPDDDGIDENVTMQPWASDYSGVSSWKIIISDLQDRTVRTISGEGQPPYSVLWDGKDDVYGRVVPEGTYKVVLSAQDEIGNEAQTEPIDLNAVIPPKVVIKEIIKEVPKEIKVTEVDRGLLVSLTSRVLFDFGKSNLKPIANKTLREVVKILNAYQENKIAVEGHTDSIGSGEFNQKLSENRAWSVANYLIKEGISAERIKVVGYGKDKPVADNATASGREANRRVEVIILK
jgi:outer membrane protein OmpA-like peptidoglycan-associated protein